LIGSTSSMCRIKGEAAAPVDNNRRHERGAQKKTNSKRGSRQSTRNFISSGESYNSDVVDEKK
jgi:hypothetical protein